MSAILAAPAERVRSCNQQPIRPDGEFVLYWMIAARRSTYSFALDHAIYRARELRKPLVVLEALRSDYRWASRRLHGFVLDGMAAQRRRFANSPVLYYPYVEPSKGAGKGLLAALAERACMVVTDEFPCFFLPHMVAAAAARMPVLMEEIDSNGMYPLHATDRVFTTAASFRRHLHKELPRYLGRMPHPDPLHTLELPRLAALPAAITHRWPAASDALLGPEHRGLAELPIDHSVDIAVRPGQHEVMRGGAEAADAVLRKFMEHGLPRYAEDRNQPEQEVASGLSPYLHFGHIGVHEIFHRVMTHDRWSIDRLAPKPTGSREGWWGASAPVEAFLDELITWREVGYNMTSHTKDYDRYESLPDWARATLEEHESDTRPHLYSLDQLAAGKTGDPLWNAAQGQLLREGRIHNYLRMLWGKKVLEWTPNARVALDVLIELNNKYALDGRNPNSYSGIFWCLGRYDRAWGPERPIFGKVRYMTSSSTERKLKVSRYVATYRPR